jgi:hypothetical protein
VVIGPDYIGSYKSNYYTTGFEDLLMRNKFWAYILSSS